MKDGIRRMLEAKAYCLLHVVCCFVAAFVDCSTVHDDHAYMTDMNTSYSDNLDGISDDSGLSSRIDKGIYKIEKETKSFKTLVIQVFRPHIPNVLHAFKVRLIDHLCEDLCILRNIRFINVCPLEHFNDFVNQ